MQKAFGKLDSRVDDVPEQTLIDALEASDADHEKSFVKSALMSALNELLTPIIDNFVRMRESFKDGVTQVATSLRSLTTIAAATTKDAAVIALSAKFAAETVREKINKPVKNLVVTSPSPPPSSLNLSFDESQI